MSTVRLLVLGVVRARGEAHGYAVHRQLMSWRVDTWTAVKPPSIYHAVKQLDREGKLVTPGLATSPKGPNRVLYRITEEGQREYFALLEAALRSPDIEEFGAGIAFMQSLPRRRVRELLTEQLATTRQIDADLEEMKAQWPDPGAPPHAQHLLELWRGVFRSNAEWAMDMRERLAAGEFCFAED
ncbi:MAG: PadR family transcriptional regulator [Polyangiaceae bacterium]|nr:PadR family transcriptional regulator [Polyangiaceae bacterium]